MLWQKFVFFFNRDTVRKAVAKLESYYLSAANKQPRSKPWPRGFVIARNSNSKVREGTAALHPAAQTPTREPPPQRC